MLQHIDVRVPSVLVDDSFEGKFASFQANLEVFRSMASERALITADLHATLMEIQINKQQSRLLREETQRKLWEFKFGTPLFGAQLPD